MECSPSRTATSTTTKKNLKFLVELELCNAVNGIDNKCHRPMQLMTDRSTTCTQTLNPKNPELQSNGDAPILDHSSLGQWQIGIYKIVHKALLWQRRGYQIYMPLNPNVPRPLIKGRTPRLSVWTAFGMQSCKRETHKILHLKQTKTCNGSQICAIWVTGEKSGVTFGDGVFWNQKKNRNSCSNLLDLGIRRSKRTALEASSRESFRFYERNCNLVGGFPTINQVLRDSIIDFTPCFSGFKAHWIRIIPFFKFQGGRWREISSLWGKVGEVHYVHLKPSLFLKWIT